MIVAVTSAAALLMFMTFCWVAANKLKRLDIVDIAWGFGFVIITITVLGTATVDGLLTSPLLVVGVLIFVWAVRLSEHLFKRVAGRKHEDVRYVELRKKWKGNEALNSYIRVFLLQAVLIFAIVFPPLAVLFQANLSLNPWLFIGLAVWLIGFFFESIGDQQLSQFAGDSKNKGQLITTGLWKYTRHPNYFGEVTMWWGIFLMTVPALIANPTTAWVALISPVVITVLILFISGVPLTEKLMSKRKGWKEYAARTSKFLPLPPKKS